MNFPCIEQLQHLSYHLDDSRYRVLNHEYLSQHRNIAYANQGYPHRSLEYYPNLQSQQSSSLRLETRYPSDYVLSSMLDVNL